MTAKLRVGLLFGGRSAEHDVSIMSARNVLAALDPDRYDVYPIAVDRSGAWRLCRDLDGGIPASVPETGLRVGLLPGGGGQLLTTPEGMEDGTEPPTLDVLFPVLHGPYGEDGTVQGAAELAGVPCVGPGVSASAAAMDKDIAKRLLQAAGFKVARHRCLVPGQPVPDFAELVAELGRPIFVKPARLGSSVGISKADSDPELRTAIEAAFRHDTKILLEACVHGREIECGILESEDGTLLASVPGEIVPTNRYDFYTYEAKYLEHDGADLRVPADLPPGLTERFQSASREAFTVLGCTGMARVDFFLVDGRDMVVNELNTIPGFTDASMYPRVFAASGVPYAELVDRLIRHALADR